MAGVNTTSSRTNKAAQVMAQTKLARNRCGTERSSGSAARAARDLKNPENRQTCASVIHHDPITGLQPLQGRRRLLKGLAEVVEAFMKLRAARAALPELRSVPHLFRASYACGITWSALGGINKNAAALWAAALDASAGFRTPCQSCRSSRSRSWWRRCNLRRRRSRSAGP